ncbi:MAG: 3-dehydroquinate synthase [bacterium]|jgi:shikimate kinase/3-dehydroquinate synthase|nr:3-dehydroquinate synthase [bacterium]MDD3805680.1 3-dehydroquinate synthase [bacterium]MDD4153288.1 3-dehydroquinate synthase [bacterium]MDD4557789.1 3-dehydroquinate synthase [bacterium]
MNIILAGFMGSGKSSVGPLLARMMGIDFLDTDSLIETKAGKSIDSIFRDEGEGFFRELESSVLAGIKGEDKVIAIGGGALVNTENIHVLKKKGLLIVLRVSPQTAAVRLADAPGRPLLNKIDGDREKLAALMAEREAGYGKADIFIETDNLSPQDVAKAIFDRLSSSSMLHESSVTVDLKKRSYEILISERIDAWHERIAATGFEGKLALITDDNVAPLYLDRVSDDLKGTYAVYPIVLKAGEASKTLSEAERIYDVLLQYGFDRSSGVLALGGGVVGDLAGFVASTYMRGLAFFQAPTTLLAQVDSSVGGKVAVNHPLTKNLIGAFYQPRLVIAETNFLRTLPMREIRAGLAEVIKYGIIYDTCFFRFLERSAPQILALQPDTITEVINKSCLIKSLVVSEDEREEGQRAILNYGHTIGHALEYAGGYSSIVHGEAVAAGMAAAARLSVLEGLLSREDEWRQNSLISRFGLSLKYASEKISDVLAALSRDKKCVDSVPSFILAEGIGKVGIVKQVNDDNLREAIESILQSPGCI